jgi:hypothetical protein
MLKLSRVAAFCFVLYLLFLQGPLGCISAEKIDINSASLEDLTKIIHIGEARAKELISLRPFSSLDDLARIKGIGPARLQDIKNQGLAYTDKDVPAKEAEPLANEKIAVALEEEEKEWTKTQTPDREYMEEAKENKNGDVNYSLISLPLAVISAGSILLLKNNVKIK